MNLGAKIKAKDAHGFTALLIAASYGYVEIIKLLLDRKADIEDRLYSEYWYSRSETPLIIAAEYGHEEAVDVLLAHGARVNAVDRHNSTALHLVSSSCYYNIAKKLINCGADINAKDSFVRTPLMIAAEYGKLEIVKLLLDRGANTYIQTQNFSKGHTALIYACERGHLDVVEELLATQ